MTPLDDTELGVVCDGLVVMRVVVVVLVEDVGGIEGGSVVRGASFTQLEFDMLGDGLDHLP
jgi:hypothetical protein